MRLLVPQQQIEITYSIQQCLLVAKQHGFATEEICLGVSSSDQFELHNDQEVVIRISSDTIGAVTKAESVDWHFCYQFSAAEPLTVDDVRRQDWAANTIFIGLRDEQGYVDAWQHHGEARALSYLAGSVFSTEQHLAWVISLLALDFPIEDALTFSHAQLNVSRETWANDFTKFPTPVLEDPRLGVRVGWAANAETVTFPNMDKHQVGLYPVVDNVTWIERLLKLGINTVQLRIKDSKTPDLEAQVKRAIELGQEHQAQVFINDYWQLAIKHGAYGVHLGQEDIEESNLSQLAQAGICLGLSTHGYYELLRIVQINPSYIALGHIFPTTTKEMPSKPQGLVRLGHYQDLINSIPYGAGFGYPTVAIGGIDLTNADQVWQCGVSSLAVVRAITLADSPQQVIEQFEQIMQPVMEEANAI
ncbi:thiamine phosphate synthase [Vibrio sp. WXL210]|uniref:thiamine phosphate synthase n=1 Tax=Vibrio sp. WXL210 TaxID=3450709 RepID=UPI003EC54E77